MPVVETKKLLITDPDTGRLIRCNTDGSEWEEWGYYLGGVPLNIGGVDLHTYDDYRDAIFDEDNKIVWYACKTKGLLKLDLVSDIATVYNVAGGNLRSDSCFGLTLTSDGSKLIVLHGDTNGLTILDPTDGTKLADFACGTACCEQGALSNDDTHIVVWTVAPGESTCFTTSRPALVKLSDGTTTFMDWGATGITIHDNHVFIDDCCFAADDSELYIEMHFRRSPLNGVTDKIAHTTIDAPLTPSMTITAMYYCAECTYFNDRQLGANVGIINVGQNYHAHAWKNTTGWGPCKLSFYRLSDNQFLKTYDVSTAPVFGHKDAETSWKTWYVRKSKDGGLYLIHNQSRSDLQYDQVLLTIYEIDPVVITASGANVIAKVFTTRKDDTEVVEENKKEGVDISPVYTARGFHISGRENQYTGGYFHETENCFAVGHAPGISCVTPHISSKDFPWGRINGLYKRATDGTLFLYDESGRRIVRFLGWKEGGRLAFGYVISKDGEGYYNTRHHVGLIEATSRVVYESASRIIWTDDFEYDAATTTAILFPSGAPTMFRLVPSTGILYVAGMSSKIVYRYGTDEAAKDWHNYQGDGWPMIEFRDVWIDPDTGFHYYLTSYSIIRADAFVVTDWASYGSNGSGVDQFSSPRGIFGDGDYLYVADTGNHRIVRIDKAAFDGTGWTTWGSRGFWGAQKFGDGPYHIEGMTISTGIDEPEGMYLPPDMIRAITLAHSFYTRRFRTHSEKEVRAAHVYVPKRREVFQFATMTSVLMATLFRQVQELRAEDNFYVPVWPYAMFLSSSIAAGETDLSVSEAAFRELPDAGVLLLFQDVDHQEVAQYAARVGNAFSLTAGLSASFDAEDTIVVPCMAARFLEQQSLNRLERFKILAELIFEEVLIASS